MKRRVIAILMLFAASVVADAETNLPVVCSLASANGQPLKACPPASQTVAEGSPTALVRVCGAQACTYAERTWRELRTVTSAQWVEVCTADKPVGGAVGECQGTTSTQWGAQSMVPLSQVRMAQLETDFPGTFTVTPATGPAPLTVTLTWDASTLIGGTCTASGSWTGAKALKGSQSVTNLTAAASYTLTCTRPAPSKGAATLFWTAPTTNTDGSPLTNLAGYRIVYGTSSTALTQTVQVANAALSSYIVSNLNAGTWYFGIKAYTSAGAESALSNLVSKTVAAPPLQSFSAVRAVTIALPNAPVLRVIEAQVRNAVADHALLAFRPSTYTYGSVALGTRCDETRPIRGSYYPIPVEVVQWSSTSRPKYPVARCAVQ